MIAHPRSDSAIATRASHVWAGKSSDHVPIRRVYERTLACNCGVERACRNALLPQGHPLPFLSELPPSSQASQRQISFARCLDAVKKVNT